MPRVGPDRTDHDGHGCLAGCGLAVVTGSVLVMVGVGYVVREFARVLKDIGPFEWPAEVRLLFAVLSLLMRLPDAILAYLATGR